MNPFQISPELWRFALLLAVLIYHKTVYKLVARFMDYVTSTSSKPRASPHLKESSPSAHSTSPQMSSFHRRFLSSASISTSESVTAMESTDRLSLNKNETARSAKRFLMSKIRDDWTYPWSVPHSPQEPTCRDPLDYRVREEGSSDPEPLSDEPYDVRDPMVFTDSDPYKFESPDAIANTIVQRKRKRRRLFKEELGWNDGLRTWVERRNAWCGAVEKRPRKVRERNSNHEENGRSLSVATNSSMPLSPISQLSATSSSPVHSASDSGDDRDSDGSDEDQGPLLPIYPSLLPEDNIIRSSIKPAMYPAIYSKVVLQSLTPTVPVRLPDMIGALVQGWKSEGNWPPKGALSTTSIMQETGRRASELLKLRRRENVVVEKGRMRKGVGAVKKVLGLRTSNGERAAGSLKFEDGGSVEQSGLVDEDAPAQT